ncbi:ATP-binding cassette domain-containing protein [Microbacterium gallinarum]|uniref:ATP-binding cassette domain-containing protein n=1 Tax=Microbacterium gallinarum TaxID=2762209 RepID=A0ABR8X0E3_9MICO|nr:ATP-binding cassette domain-containing protein [Microbacterium gallinarum]MBD8022802.1 ATP-binding cassette domain-containing protein [Microbacterium gallinarum]
MPEGQVLEFSGVTKRFGAVTAVSDFTARVDPGLVTGFLGPNGAGKTTSLRMLLGLVRPTAGHATIGGAKYAKLAHPLQTVGAVLEASSFHPGRTGAAHLTVYAHAAKIPKARVDEVLGLVGLADAAGRKVGGYSLGMRQRLGLAYALLGDPGVLVLDEPTNGLDPEGIRWIRGFLRQLAREGRTVLVSSHLLTEVQQTVDALLIISQGRLVFEGGMDELVDPSERATVVDSEDRAGLAEALRAAGVPFEVLRSGLTVRGIEPAAVGLAAAAAGVPLSTLHKRGPALEEVFLDLVNGTRVHTSASGRRDDVIPALESGSTGAVPVQESVPDAAAEVSPAEADAGPDDAVPTGPDAVAAEAVASDADAVPDAPEAGDTAGVSAELNAESGGAMAGAAAVGSAEAAYDAEQQRADAEPEPQSEPEPEPALEPEPHTASFAVASTGVIDILPEDVPAADGDTATDQPAGQPAGEPGDELAEEPAEEPPFVAEDDDRSWEDYVRTDADVEADRFFAAFDDEPDPEAPSPDDAEPTGDSPTDVQDHTEPDPEAPSAGETEPDPEAPSPDDAEPTGDSPTDVHDHAEGEGGEQR